MTDAELAAFLTAHPWLRICKIPAGWQRFDTLDLRAKSVEFLMADGDVVELPPSNTVLVTLRQKPIAWRPITPTTKAV